MADQGVTDEFRTTQPRPELQKQAYVQAGHPLTLRRHAGYDHSYYFIASFTAEHFAHHARGMSMK